MSNDTFAAYNFIVVGVSTSQLIYADPAQGTEDGVPRQSNQQTPPIVTNGLPVNLKQKDEPGAWSGKLQNSDLRYRSVMDVNHPDR